jgi:hypothetical protein
MQEEEDDNDYEEEKLQLIQFAVIKKNLSLSWHKYIYRGVPV